MLINLIPLIILVILLLKHSLSIKIDITSNNDVLLWYGKKNNRKFYLLFRI